MEHGTGSETKSERVTGPVSAPVARPHVFVVLECARPLGGAARFALSDADEVVFGRGTGRAAKRSVEGGVRRLTISIPDSRMSQRHATLRAAGSDFVLEDAGSRNGTKLDGQPTTRAVLTDGAVFQLGRTLFVFRSALPTPDGLAPDSSDLELSVALPGMRTVVPQLGAQLTALARVARSDVPVLVLGETGTGKELLARAVHQLGRAGRPLVAVNCGALPPQLVESQLFGHVRGAFSGAVRDEMGFVRSADGGTLFLDEIADLSGSSQAALLRVLQEKEVVPLGATRPIPVDVRIVAATHAQLDELVVRGAFRNDLLARLGAFVFRMPPLRERREDLGLIVAEILRRVAQERASALRLDPAAGAALLAYDWPHNVRELEHTLSVALALTSDDMLGLAQLPPAVATASLERADGGAELDGEGAGLREELVAALAKHDGNVSAAAREMGRARPLVHRWLHRFRIDPNVFRKAGKAE